MSEEEIYNGRRVGKYYLVEDNLPELARLIRQDQFVNQHMHDLFPASQWATFQKALDLGCGPGGWCLEMGERFPGVEFTGVDISQRMIQYANMLAQAEQRVNVQFLPMDVVAPLPFPDQSFDLVSGRLVASFLTPHFGLGLSENALVF